MDRSMTTISHEKNACRILHNEAFYVTDKRIRRKFRNRPERVRSTCQTRKLFLSQVIRQTIATRLLLDECEHVDSDEKNGIRPPCLGAESSSATHSRMELVIPAVESTFMNPSVCCFDKRLLTFRKKHWNISISEWRRLFWSIYVYVRCQFIFCYLCEEVIKIAVFWKIRFFLCAAI